MSYKALIVDFGGVLTTPLQDAMVAFAEEQGIALEDFVRIALAAYAGEEDGLVVAFETGAISEDQFSREFAQRLSGVTGGAVDPEGLVARIFRGMRLEEGMIEAVAKAREHGLKTGMLSNSWGLGLYPRELLAEVFDTIVISAEVGLRKPDPEIFRLTTTRLGVAPRECVFVDDHPGHLKAAVDEGMATVLHRTPADTIAELESLLGVPLT
ncbi:MAG: HAD family hydrolase [Actinomycetota bacterium]